MLKKILSIAGKPGLFELVSQGNNMLIVEDLGSKQRCPAYSNDKVISLADIAIFTEEQEVPLSQVFASIQKKENGGQVNIDVKDVKKLPERPQWLSSQERPVSMLPPVDVPRRHEAGLAAASVADPAPQPESAPQRRPSGQARPATA